MGGVARFLAKAAGLIALLVLGVLAAAWALIHHLAHEAAPDPVSIARAGLVGMREQNRLSAFAARFVAVVTTRRERLGILSAERTIVMPGSVRYEVDLSRLRAADVRWNAKTHTLLVLLPPVEPTPPAIDLAATKSFGADGLLTAFTDARAELDEDNRRAGQAELAAQARAPLPMKLARDATRRAVEQDFALPLRAAGVSASVAVRFADEAPDAGWDVSRAVDDVVHDR